MTRRPNPSSNGLARAAAVLVCAALCGGQTPAAGAADYPRLLADTAPALVTVKFVLQVKFGGAMSEAVGGDQEVDSEVTCVMIGPKGLLVCSNTQFNGYVELMSRLMPQGMEVAATPKDLKVLVSAPAPPGDGPEGEGAGDAGAPRIEELAASLVVRDSDRDLVWLKIDQPGERTFPFLDLEQAVEAQVGQEVVAVYRMDRYFERAATLAETRIGSITERPRRLYVPASSFTAGLGAPVLDTGGKVVGLTVFQFPAAGEMDGGDNPLAAMSQNARLQQGIQGLILPAAELRRATAQVLALAAEDGQ
jgi:hypothetical protein